MTRSRANQWLRFAGTPKRRMSFDQAGAVRTRTGVPAESCRRNFRLNTRKGGGMEKDTDPCPGDVCYFFLLVRWTDAVFGAIVEDTPAAGAITFLGCLGFLTSRLPRVVLFAIMLLPICRSRKRQPCRASVGAIWSLCRDLYFFRALGPVLQARLSGLRAAANICCWLGRVRFPSPIRCSHKRPVTRTFWKRCETTRCCRRVQPRTLVSTGQAHCEHRFCLVGPCVDLAPMGPGNLACDVESEPQVAVGII